VGGAILRVFEAGQQVVVDRIDLARAELVAFADHARGDVVAAAARIARLLAIALLAGLLLLAGWLALSWGLLTLVTQGLSGPERIAIYGVVQVLAGALLLRQTSREGRA
jgi:hypothetical protein